MKCCNLIKFYRSIWSLVAILLNLLEIYTQLKYTPTLQALGIQRDTWRILTLYTIFPRNDVNPFLFVNFIFIWSHFFTPKNVQSLCQLFGISGRIKAENILWPLLGKLNILTVCISLCQVIPSYARSALIKNLFFFCIKICKHPFGHVYYNISDINLFKSGKNRVC